MPRFMTDLVMGSEEITDAHREKLGEGGLRACVRGWRHSSSLAAQRSYYCQTRRRYKSPVHIHSRLHPLPIERMWPCDRDLAHVLLHCPHLAR